MVPYQKEITWFEKLVGFSEENPQQVRNNIIVEGHMLKSLVNGAVYDCGELEVASLAELRERVRSHGYRSGVMSVQTIHADALSLHTQDSNAGAFFQAASQFNLLEMVEQSVTPEEGIGRYQYDLTQGPACAIAAGAGTIYRNYFAHVNGEIGQSAGNQIDCLADLGREWDNSGSRLWAMRNGYALPTREGLEEISQRLRDASEAQRDAWRELLKIGIQWHTQVTADGCKHKVSQAYCSALPVAYAGLRGSPWVEFARLILEASYEATLCAAVLNAQATGNNKVFLTSLGGGAFGNDDNWIIESTQRALHLYRHADLDVFIVRRLRPY